MKRKDGVWQDMDELHKRQCYNYDLPYTRSPLNIQKTLNIQNPLNMYREGLFPNLTMAERVKLHLQNMEDYEQRRSSLYKTGSRLSPSNNIFSNTSEPKDVAPLSIAYRHNPYDSDAEYSGATGFVHTLRNLEHKGSLNDENIPPVGFALGPEDLDSESLSSDEDNINQTESVCNWAEYKSNALSQTISSLSKPPQISTILRNVTHAQSIIERDDCTQNAIATDLRQVKTPLSVPSTSQNASETPITSTDENLYWQKKRYHIDIVLNNEREEDKRKILLFTNQKDLHEKWMVEKELEIENKKQLFELLVMEKKQDIEKKKEIFDLEIKERILRLEILQLEKAEKLKVVG